MSREVRPGRRQFEARIIPALEGADAVVYSLVGLVFLVTAFGMLGYSVIAFPTAVTGAILAITIALYLLGRREVPEP